MSEMGPINSSSRRAWRISACPAANGMSDSRAVPMATEAPSATNRATASSSDRSFIVYRDGTRQGRGRNVDDALNLGGRAPGASVVRSSADGDVWEVRLVGRTSYVGILSHGATGRNCT